MLVEKCDAKCMSCETKRAGPENKLVIFDIVTAAHSLSFLSKETDDRKNILLSFFC